MRNPFYLFGGPGSGPQEGNQNAAKGSADEASAAANKVSETASTPEEHDKASILHSKAQDAHYAIAKEHSKAMRSAEKESSKHIKGAEKSLGEAQAAATVNDVGTFKSKTTEAGEHIQASNKAVDTYKEHEKIKNEHIAKAVDHAGKAFRHMGLS